MTPRLIACTFWIWIIYPGVVLAQTLCPPRDLVPVVNPSAAEWTESIDHADVTTYVLDIVRASDDMVIQTLDLGLGTPIADTPGDREASINVQPIAFGEYCAVMRAEASALESVDSLPSNTWVREPGGPSGLRVR